MRNLIWPVAILLVAIIINSLVHRASCAYYGYQTERNTRYAVFVGCMVEVDNHWYPRSELRVAQ